VVIVVSLIAAIGDARRHRIPNALTGPLLVGGLICALLIGGLSGLGTSLAATFLIALPFFILWLLGGSGAGDAKMMGAVAAWLGLRAGFETLAAVALAGGILCLGFALARRHATTTFRNMAVVGFSWLYLLKGRGMITGGLPHLPQTVSTRVPYGIAIFAGICVAATWRVL
jgi:prepilin peptidase CpaA